MTVIIVLNFEVEFTSPFVTPSTVLSSIHLVDARMPLIDIVVESQNLSYEMSLLVTNPK